MRDKIKTWTVSLPEPNAPGHEHRYIEEALDLLSDPYAPETLEREAKGTAGCGGGIDSLMEWMNWNRKAAEYLRGLADDLESINCEIRLPPDEDDL